MIRDSQAKVVRDPSLSGEPLFMAPLIGKSQEKLESTLEVTGRSHIFSMRWR